MKLLIDNSWDSGQVPVSWCLNQEDRDKIKDKIQTEADRGHDVTPYIVIDVIPDGRTDTRIRQVAKLTQQKAYLTFNVAGKNRVFAGIIFPRKGLDDEKMKEGLMTLYGRGNYQRIFHAYTHSDEIGPEDHALNEICSGHISLMEWTYRTVDVPEQWFAKEPPAWLKKYATMYWSSGNVDECDMRKKIIFAFTAQTFLLIPFLSIIGLLYGVVLFAVAFFMTFVMGFRDMRWQVVWQQLKAPYYPFSDSPKEIYETYGSDFNSYFKVDAEGELRPWYIRILRPWLVILTISSGAIILLIFRLSPSGWATYIGYAVVAGVITALVALLFFKVIVMIANYAEVKSKDAKQAELDKLPAKQRELQSRIDNMLLCDDSLSDDNLPEIPKEEQTVYLRFLKVKGSVCKNYQQS